MARKRNGIAEFIGKIALVTPGGCLVWGGWVTERGYGMFKMGGRYRSAHRYAYEMARGPIPEGLTIDHLCREKRCVNVRHFEVVTNKENILRGDGPTAVNARKTHCVHGHEFTAENTRAKHGERECRICLRAAERRRAKRKKP